MKIHALTDLSDLTIQLNPVQFTHYSISQQLKARYRQALQKEKSINEENVNRHGQ
jgi:hypothetical protein